MKAIKIRLERPHRSDHKDREVKNRVKQAKKTCKFYNSEEL